MQNSKTANFVGCKEIRIQGTKSFGFVFSLIRGVLYKLNFVEDFWTAIFLSLGQTVSRFLVYAFAHRMVSRFYVRSTSQQSMCTSWNCYVGINICVGQCIASFFASYDLVWISTTISYHCFYGCKWQCEFIQLISHQSGRTKPEKAIQIQRVFHLCAMLVFIYFLSIQIISLSNRHHITSNGETNKRATPVVKILV